MTKAKVLLNKCQKSACACADKLLQILSTTPELEAELVPNLAMAKQRLQITPFQLALLFLGAAEFDGSETIIQTLTSMPHLGLLVCTCAPLENITRQLVHLPCDDFIICNSSPHEILARLRRCLDGSLSTELDEVKRHLLIKHGVKNLVGRDPKFCQAVAKIQQIAACDVPVLLTGETGTGKEVFARTVHYLSPRAGKPFVPVNCAAIPTDLFENELFGHARGAYTGATEQREGLIQAANHGTLFLDEVDSLAPLQQAKLLRFLEEHEFKPLGMNRTCKADVRIVAAGLADLWKKVQAGKFRDDLFYRLNVISVYLPPLRERKGDIPLLAEHFLQKYAEQLHKRLTGFGAGVRSVLENYPWPGNIRQLENTINHAVAVAQHSVIHLSDLNLTTSHEHEFVPSPKSFKADKAKLIADFERRYLTELLAAHGGNISQAAHAAHKDRRSFWGLLKKYHIDPHAHPPQG
jgi:two-component system, NtrC family, response regulator GlrR